MVRTSAPNSSGGLFVDENVGGGITGTTVVASDMNNHQEEIANAITGAGLTLSGADQSQLRKAIVALSHVVGELVLSEFEEAPSTYFPALPRNVNQDISSTNWPALVTKLRAVKTKVLAVTDHSVTVSGSNITFPNTNAANSLLALLVEDAIVSNYLNSGEPDNFTGGATYAVAALRRTVNIAGTDYAITGINTTTRVVTVSGTPASGAQSASCYTYRIAGSSTTARLLRIAGFVGVAAGDAGGEVVGGFRRMDRGQGHWHNVSGGSITGGTKPSQATGATTGRNMNDTGGTSYALFDETAHQITTDLVNGTPRTGKTTDPRTAGQHAYTWGGIYL
jgi:hypothetical protein